MKNKHMKKIVVFSILMVSGILAFAQETPRADARQGAQRARIASGRRNGEVTGREAVLLNSEQRHIRRTERRAKADGTVSAQEKTRIERKQSRANRHIRRAKHNGIEK
jgi:hypothetical protein